MINCLGRCGSINFKTGVKSTIIAQKGTNNLCLCSKKRLIMPWNLCIIQKQAVFIWLLFQLNLNHYDSYRGFYVEDGYTLKLTSKNCRLVFDKLAEGGCAISVFFVEIYIYIFIGNWIMQFESFHWLSHHGIWDIIPWSTKMASVSVIFWAFLFLL